MEQQKPRWAEMCSRILQQCEVLSGGRAQLAARLDVHPQDLAFWLAGKSGPPTAAFDKAMDIIMAEHERRGALEQAGQTPPRRRRFELSH